MKEILHARISLSRPVDINKDEWEAEIRERLGPLGEISNLEVEKMVSESVVDGSDNT